MAKADPPHLRVTRLQLSNWRNFKAVDIELANRVFVVGANASGKSNLLDSVRFLGGLTRDGGGLQQAVKERGGVSSLRALVARQNPRIEIKVALGSLDNESSKWHYELGFTHDPKRGGRPVVTHERVINPSGEKILSRPDGLDDQDPERLAQTALEQVIANREFREIYGFAREIRYLHIVPQLVREPDRSVGRTNDPFGGDFLKQIAETNGRTREARLRRITQALQVAVPQLEELVLEPDRSDNAWHLKGRYAHWRKQGAWQTEAAFSDGTLRLLGLLWSLLDGQGPILLEEPELSLHPEVVSRMPQMLNRVQRGVRTRRQILLSTHSAALLADPGIGLDEVLLLVPGQEGTTVRPASDFDEIALLLDGGLTMGDAVLPTTAPDRAPQLALFPAP